jgi:hypothetical protein
MKKIEEVYAVGVEERNKNDNVSSFYDVIWVYALNCAVKLWV